MTDEFLAVVPAWEELRRLLYGADPKRATQLKGEIEQEANVSLPRACGHLAMYAFVLGAVSLDERRLYEASRQMAQLLRANVILAYNERAVCRALYAAIVARDENLSAYRAFLSRRLANLSPDAEGSRMQGFLQGALRLIELVLDDESLHLDPDGDEWWVLRQIEPAPITIDKLLELAQGAYPAGDFDGEAEMRDWLGEIIADLEGFGLVARADRGYVLTDYGEAMCQAGPAVAPVNVADVLVEAGDELVAA